MIDGVLEVLAPHSCCGCGYQGSLLCEFCKYDITSDPFTQCLICLQPTSGDNLCKRCLNNSPFTRAWCLGERRGSLKSLLDRYKFDSARRAGVIVADMLDVSLPVLPAGIHVAPVPTAPSHRRVRGFDHTRLIAKRLAALRAIPVSRALIREGGRTQHFLGKADRLTVAREGLRVRGSVPACVLLLDDIYTTGATVRACADVLRDHGAQEIFVAVIARQTLDDIDHL